MSNSSPLLFKTSFTDALAKIDSVRAALLTHDIKIGTHTSMGALFAKVLQLNKENSKHPGVYDYKKFFASMEALWIAEALLMAIDEPGSRIPIRRIVGSDMDLSGRSQSQGKDALWELDVFRRLKLGGADARLEEPDVVVTLSDGLGEYGVACKKVYVESGVANALADGCDQLKRANLPGIVMFNLDELMEEKALLHAPTMAILHAEVTRRARAFISRHHTVFQQMIDQGKCDGVMLSITIVYETPDVSPSIKLARIPVRYSHPHRPALSQLATARLDAFVRYIDNGAIRR